jgi:hypothetical protein
LENVMTDAQTHSWNPERTWVFVVGTLEWKHAEYYDPFPHENRRDGALVEFFRGQGVPAAQIAYLCDRQATTRRIQQALEAQLQAAGSGDLLVLYYCGHGTREDDGAAYFASYDAGDRSNPGWEVDSIPATIERCFGGAQALLLADCCYSGCLAEAVARHAARVAYACLTSSLASELSTGNWTFTEALLSGLRGQAFVDADADRSITLAELAGQIVDSMAFAEEQLATFATAGAFDPGFVVAAARPRLGPRVGARVEVLSEGEWYPAQIVDVRGQRFKVHYYGYEQSDDEWVGGDQMREAARAHYPVGAAVEVQWKRKWYPARVVAARAGIHQIQYDGYDPDWNEWVASKRIRAAS